MSLIQAKQVDSGWTSKAFEKLKVPAPSFLTSSKSGKIIAGIICILLFLTIFAIVLFSLKPSLIGFTVSEEIANLTSFKQRLDIVTDSNLEHSFELEIGDRVEVDLDKDSINDIAIELESIKERKATVRVMLLEKLRPAVAGVCLCPECSNWTQCIKGKQYRTCYKCGPETNFTCIEDEEERVCIEVRHIIWPYLIIVLLLALVYVIYRVLRKKK